MGQYEKVTNMNQLFKLRLVIIVLAIVTLASCETLRQQVNTPEVSLVSVQMAEQQGLRQMFDVTLAVSNPNAIDLSLVGVNYTLALEGLDVVKGSSNNVPTIPAYGEQNIEVRLGIGLLEGIQFINKLTQKDEPSLDYSLQMQLDTGMPVFGVIPISRSGKLDSSSFSR